MRVKRSRKYYIDQDKKYQLTDCLFDNKGRKIKADIFKSDGSLSHTCNFEYLENGYRESARLPSGEIKYYSEYLFGDGEINPIMEFYRPDNSVICRFIMYPDLLETAYYNQSGYLIKEDKLPYISKRFSIEFSYDDLDNIFGEIYIITDRTDSDVSDYRESVSGDKKRIEYYSLDRSEKITEFYSNDKLLYKHRTEIEYS